MVYTIAGVAIVATGAGAAYYVSNSGRHSIDAAGQENKRLSKKERRKAKQEKEKEKEKEKTQADARSTSKINNEASKTATVESDPSEGIPQIDESSVENLSDEVGFGPPIDLF